VVAPSAGLIEAALLILYLAPAPKLIPWAGLIIGLGLGALFPSLQALAIGSTPASGQTRAAGLSLNGTDLGLSLNTLAMGVLAGLLGTYRVVFAVSAVFPLLIWLTYGLHPAFRERPRLD
jgi:MFS family permease